MRTEDILARARTRLGDQAKDRWSDVTLISYLNEGQTDIAIKSEIFKATAVIQLIKGQYLYKLPTNALRAFEVLFANIPVNVVPSDQMDRLYGVDWRLHTTESAQVSAIVTDRQDQRTVRVYPRVFADAMYSSAEFSPTVYGVTDEVSEYTTEGVYGLAGSIYDTELLDEPVSLYGVIADMTEGEYLTVEYIRKAEKVTTINSDPELPEIFDTALVRYIAGAALRDDTNAQNRAMGNEELSLYVSILQDIIGVSSTGSMTISNNSQTQYRGMGE